MDGIVNIVKSREQPGFFSIKVSFTLTTPGQ